MGRVRRRFCDRGHPPFSLAMDPLQAYLALPEKIRQALREDIRQSVGDTGRPVDIDVQYRFASGRR